MSIVQTALLGVADPGWEARLGVVRGEVPAAEEADTAALGSMDLTGYRVSFDAAHRVRNTLRQLTLYNGADYLGRLKANQPNALTKAQQLLPGDVPPSTGVD